MPASGPLLNSADSPYALPPLVSITPNPFSSPAPSTRSTSTNTSLQRPASIDREIDIVVPTSQSREHRHSSPGVLSLPFNSSSNSNSLSKRRASTVSRVARRSSIVPLAAATPAPQRPLTVVKTTPFSNLIPLSEPATQKLKWLPSESVGSMPRPQRLQTATKRFDHGEIRYEELRAVQDECTIETVERMEEVARGIEGSLVCDGEQHAPSFASYPLVDSLNNTGLASNFSCNGQLFAIYADGHERRMPKLIEGPFRFRRYRAQLACVGLGASKGPAKVAVVSPSMLSLLYPLDEQIPGYPRSKFLDDVCNECETDIRMCFAAGASRVSIDFTEGRLANKNDVRNPWTVCNKLLEFIDLNNRVIDRFSPEERRNIGVHTCAGSDCDTTHSSDVPYETLLPLLFHMNAGYFLIQCCSEVSRKTVYELCAKYSREDAQGVAQVCFFGVTNPLNPRVETPEEVCEALVEAAEYLPVERLGSTDDCGFSPFSTDQKPWHSSSEYARVIAFNKIRARVTGTWMASLKLLGS